MQYAKCCIFITHTLPIFDNMYVQLINVYTDFFFQSSSFWHKGLDPKLDFCLDENNALQYINLTGRPESNKWEKKKL